MKIENFKFDLENNRVIKVLSGEIIRIANIRIFFKKPEQYSIIKYKGLLINSSESEPYLNLINTIARELDDTNFSVFEKKLNKIKFFLISIIAFFIIIITVFSTTEKSIKSFFHFLNIDIGIPLIQIILIGVFLLVVIGLLFTDIIETLPIFKPLVDLDKKPNKYFNRFQRFKKREKKEISDFITFSKKWFKKNKQYVIVAYYLNYEISSTIETSIYELIIKLLEEHDNIKLVYLNDKNDLYDSTCDVLLAELENRNIKFEELKFDSIDSSYLLEFIKTKYPHDIGFYEAFIEKMSSFKPNEIQLVFLFENIQCIYDEFKKNKNVSFGQLYHKKGIEETKITNIKDERIIECFFRKKNNWAKIEKQYDLQLIFFELLLYNYFFFNKPLKSSLVEKFLVIHQFCIDSKQGRVTLKELASDLINSKQDYIGKYIEGIKNFDAKMYENLRSVNYDAELEIYELDKSDIWISNYVINNKYEFDNKLHFENLSKIEDFAKFFIFFRDEPNSIEKVIQYERAFDFLNKDDKFLFKLFIANKLMSIPSQEDIIGNYYIQGSKIAQEAWASFDENLKVSNLSLRIFGSFKQDFRQLNIKPYRTLYYVVSDSINKAGFAKLNLERIIRIIKLINESKFVHDYGNQLKSLNSKCEELFERYDYYVSPNDFVSDKAISPYLRLITEIENSIVILLPKIEDEKRLDELLSINLSVFEDDYMKNKSIRKKDLDYLFLLCLTIIHNNSYYSEEKREIVSLNRKSNEDLKFLKDLLNDFKERLLELGRKKLNYKKNNYYDLYKAKFHLTLNILNELGFDFSIEYSIEDINVQFEKQSSIIKQFKNIEDYFGIVDTYFWFSWFDIRLNYSLISKTSENVLEILKYIQPLTYFHLNNGLIYMGVVSNSAIPPATAYNLIHELIIDKKRTIPNFIKVKFLESLKVICYNGEFANSEVLRKESLQITDTLLLNYSNYLDDDEILKCKFSKLSLLTNNIEENKKTINALLEEIHPKIKYLPNKDKGLFYFYFISYLYENDEKEKIIENNYIELAKKYLAENKFYYLQFLRRYIHQYHGLIIAEKEIITSVPRKYFIILRICCNA